MLAIDSTSRPLALAARTLLADRGEIFLERGLECHPHMIVPGLGDEADGVGLGVEQRAFNPGSFETERPGRRVMPKAVNVA
jgi:hypothetical protein